MFLFRYADRAKKIKNKAVVNENPMDKLIRELKEENERLKKAMGGDLPVSAPGATMTEEGKKTSLTVFCRQIPLSFLTMKHSTDNSVEVIFKFT